jgi:UDP-N-acetyl-D-mannosaminuronate dehydrogenase
VDDGELHAEPLEAAVVAADASVVITDHTSLDYEMIAARAKLIIDTRNALKHFKQDNIVRL